MKYEPLELVNKKLLSKVYLPTSFLLNKKTNPHAGSHSTISILTLSCHHSDITYEISRIPQCLPWSSQSPFMIQFITHYYLITLKLNSNYLYWYFCLNSFSEIRFFQILDENLYGFLYSENIANFFAKINLNKSS